MKTTSVSLLFFSIIVLSCSSCDDASNSRGTIFASGFDNASDLNLWTQSSGGEAVIEQDYLKLKAETGCFVFETLDLIPVHKGNTYTLKFKGKADRPQVGDPAFCVGYYMVYVDQRNTNHKRIWRSHHLDTKIIFI